MSLSDILFFVHREKLKNMKKLTLLRNLMEKYKLNGYIIPMGDSHNSEYLSNDHKRM